jgi:hypothetical protein
VALVTIVANRLIFFRFFADKRILSATSPCNGTVRGGRAVFADREIMRRPARAFDARALNDNELEGELPTLPELFYLRRGFSQPGGKLPLFDLDGQAVDAGVVRRCLERGWSEPWFNNPLKPDWLVCKLTQTGRQLATAA